jgi:hypothetical protein
MGMLLRSRALFAILLSSLGGCAESESSTAGAAAVSGGGNLAHAHAIEAREEAQITWNNVYGARYGTAVTQMPELLGEANTVFQTFKDP